MSDGEHRESNIAVNSLSGINFRLHEFIKILAYMLSAAAIMASAVWKVGTYFQALTDEIANLRKDVVDVKVEMEQQQSTNVHVDNRLSKLEVEQKVKEAVKKELDARMP